MSVSAQSFFAALHDVSRDEANAAIRTLSEHFQLEDPSRAAFLALVCGSLVERGCDPQAIASPLTERLAGLLKSAVELADACMEQLPGTDDEDSDELFDQKRAELASTMVAQNAAWEALDKFWRPAIAVYSHDVEARSSARYLLELATRISENHEGGHWLALMLAVLDNEPLLVIEPKSKLGIVGRMSGVVDNFQLNVLLMDAFPKSGLFQRRRVPQVVVDVAKGNGPQQSGHTVTSIWNLYTWEAVGSDLALPDAKDFNANAHWIWNEGNPADIPIFEGHRVVLLGPHSYPRSWQSQRMFDKLNANLEIEGKLTKNEIGDWLQRMAAAK